MGNYGDLDIKTFCNTGPACQDFTQELSQTGGKIKFSITEYDPLTCKEFLVAIPDFNVTRWLMWTGGITLAAYTLGLHMKDSGLLCALAVVIGVALLAKVHFKIRYESILVMKSLGVQITRVYVSGRQSSTFYDISEIKDVVINEAITMHRVFFYLTLLLKDEENPLEVGKLVPLFQNTCPSLNCLRRIYKDTQALLQGEER